MTTIYLTRHGETEENASRILQGHLPGKLSPLGIQQIQALRDKLKDTAFDAILCSDLKRCIDSANILAEGRDLTPTPLPMLRERNWGSFTGCRIDDVQHTPIPEDVETVDEMLKRAAQFLDFVRKNYEGKTVLVMSHGLFARAIQSVFHQKSMKEIERMQNAECRILVL